MEVHAALAITLLMSLCASGAHSAKFTITNNCPFTVWPGTLTGAGKPQLSTTGFELAPKASFSLDAPAGWSGRIWGRTECTSSSGKFTCATGDCASGQVTCNGAGGIPPASLIELALVQSEGKDFYDVSLVDGFNLPMSLAPQGGSGDCKQTSCPANVNSVCPQQLAVKGSDGKVVACKSACLAFNTPQTCCTGEYNNPNKCQPTQYSKIFKQQCPLAYSYAYDDKTSTFTCSGANYAITFCP
ncbi:hypothetical protein RIF29_17725 [Crotalaria pallida]|uniref:Thaumatin-like protein n=1 Tax=Crotalaria pallida TaxID=3830 RepID=A0AAN9FHM8_CROPI